MSCSSPRELALVAVPWENRELILWNSTLERYTPHSAYKEFRYMEFPAIWTERNGLSYNKIFQV